MKGEELLTKEELLEFKWPSIKREIENWPKDKPKLPKVEMPRWLKKRA